MRRSWFLAAAVAALTLVVLVNLDGGRTVAASLPPPPEPTTLPPAVACSRYLDTVRPSVAHYTRLAGSIDQAAGAPPGDISATVTVMSFTAYAAAVDQDRETVAEAGAPPAALADAATGFYRDLGDYADRLRAADAAFRVGDMAAFRTAGETIHRLTVDLRSDVAGLNARC